jgi:hypothetical protein
MSKFTERIRVRGYYVEVEADSAAGLADKIKRLRARAASDIPTTNEDEIDHRRNRRHFEGYDY